jgi:membrane protein implicated in regulation of membrane protease activity
MTRDDPDLGPVRSALTLRLWLAGFGLVFCGVAAAIVAVTGPLWLAVLLLVLAVVAVVDLWVVARRKRRGEPG